MSSNVYNSATGTSAYVVPGQSLPAGFAPTAAQNDHLTGTSRGYNAPFLTANAANPQGLNASTGQPLYSPTGPATQSSNYSSPGTPPDPSKPFNAGAIGAGTNPLTIPTPAPSNNPATPIIAGAQASQDSAEAQAEKNVQEENKGVTDSQAKSQGLLDSVKSILGMESSLQTASANRPEVDQANADLANINTQIADTNVKLRGVTDEINGRGDIPKAGQQSLLDNANAMYGRQLADLAIRQSAASNNVEALTKAADEKLKLALAPLETELSYYKDFAIQNQENLTKDEQTKVSQIIAEKTDILNRTQTQETAKTDLLKTALTNGVKLTDAQTQGVLNAPDAASAAAFLARNGISLANPVDQAYKAAQTQKLISDAKTSGSSYVSIPSQKGGGVNIPTDVAPYYNESHSGVGYVDASSMVGTAAEKTKIIQDATAAGLKVITNKNTAADLVNIADANSKLDTISTVMAGIAQPGALSRALYGAGMTSLATKAQTDPQKAASGALQSVGLDILKAISGIQGFRGNSSVVAQVTEHLPTIYDTNATVNQKIEYIRNLISDRENAALGQTGTNIGATDLSQRASKGGYDYQAMKADGYSDADISAALKAQGI